MSTDELDSSAVIVARHMDDSGEASLDFVEESASDLRRGSAAVDAQHSTRDSEAWTSL